MGQQPQRRPFVADPKEWEVVNDDGTTGGDYEAMEEKQATPAQTWSDRLGLNEPTDSMMTGFLRGSGGAAVDMTQGAASEIMNLLQQKLQGDNAAQGALVEPTNPRSIPRREIPGGMIPKTPPTLAGKIGTYLPEAAALAAPVGSAVKAGVEAIPTTAKAGAKFQEVMGAAKNVPLDVKDVGDAALRIQQLADRGGSMPMAVRKILNRMTDPGKGPLVYEEARDFASNISRLSANEFGRLTPAVAREVANLRVALNEANAQAAKIAGKGAEYKAAMREYAKAMRLKDAIDTAVKGAKKAVPVATAAGVGYWLTREVKSLLGAGE